MTICQQELRAAGKAYPRTCQLCGLGPCKKGSSFTAVEPLKVVDIGQASRAETVRMLRKLADEIEGYSDTGQGVIAVTVTLNTEMDRIDVYGAGAGCDKNMAIGILTRGIRELSE